MRPLLVAAIAALVVTACGTPTEQYGFVTRLGRDTVSLERVTRRGDRITSDEVDRFPTVRRRHTEMELAPNGSIRHMVMDIHTPSEPEKQRDRRVTVNVARDTVEIVKRDGNGGVRWVFPTRDGIAMPHLPQMYSLYDLYIATALKRADSLHLGAGIADSVQIRQYYIDREFDRFPLHRGIVWRTTDGKVDIAHDWLAGIGEATVDSARRLLTYSGARTTYKVSVERLATPPDIEPLVARFTADEAKTGVKSLSVRDTVRAQIGSATFTIDYGRPLARGRTLLGDVIPYDRVWRTGANAATQFTTSAPITLARMSLAPGKYTLWTIPHATGAELIVNRQSGQWGTSYDESQDLGKAALITGAPATPVEAFTISITPVDARRGTLAMEWGNFRWTAPIVVR